MSDELTKLPDGWEWAQLSQVVSAAHPLCYGVVQPGEEVEQGTNLVRVCDLVDGTVQLDTLRKISEEIDHQYKRSKVYGGELLVSLVGTIGRVAVVPKQIEEANISRAIARVHPVNEISVYWLLYWLQTNEMQDWLNREAREVTRKTLNLNTLETTLIPIAPLSEQKRIVTKIEELRDRHQRAKQAFEAIPELCNHFRQSVLAAAFRGDLTADWRKENPNLEPASVLLTKIEEERNQNELEQSKKVAQKINLSKPEYFNIPETWEITLSHSLFSFVTSGSRGWAKYYSENGAMFIRVGNLDRGTICLDLTHIQRVKPPEGAEVTRTRVQPGDIVISITADIGMIGIIPTDMPEAYINQHVALARPLKSFCQEYLAWYLASSQDGLRQFQQLQRGATKTGLGLDDIKSVWVPFPPLKEQKEIVQRIETFFRALQPLERQHKDMQEQLNRLNQSILSKAFRGELVEQDPNDEPASVLLERIRANREKADNGKTKGK